MKGFIYEQSTGHLAVVNDDHECPIYVGSAGRASGRNNPEAEHLFGTGPIPRGDYYLRVVAHRRFAAPAIHCEPKGETARRLRDLGRSGFYVHGGTKSEGCILVQKTGREAIEALISLGFGTLRVIS